MNGSVMVPLLIAVVIVVIVVAVARSRRANDGVDSFRRQIDALSPAARRPVIDQVQNAAGRQPARDDEQIDEDSVEHDGEPDDEDGVRGA